MPNLPHYRYNRVRNYCYELKQLGYLKETGRTDVSINYMPTDFFKQWRAAESGLDFRKYRKLIYPPQPRAPKKRKCRVCEAEFESLNYNQKWCTKICKGKAKIYPKVSTHQPL